MEGPNPESPKKRSVTLILKNQQAAKKLKQKKLEESKNERERQNRLIKINLSRNNKVIGLSLVLILFIISTIFLVIFK
jgi:hypothetical protein